jgi:N-acetylglucosamine-6-sulfatase
LNGYGLKPAGGPSHIPPGWHQWFGLVGNSVYYNYTISDNGTAVKHGDDYHKDYLTDVLNRRLMKFLDHETPDRPFLAIVAPPAAPVPTPKIQACWGLFF